MSGHRVVQWSAHSCPLRQPSSTKCRQQGQSSSPFRKLLNRHYLNFSAKFKMIFTFVSSDSQICSNNGRYEQWVPKRWNGPRIMLKLSSKLRKMEHNFERDGKHTRMTQGLFFMPFHDDWMFFFFSRPSIDIVCLFVWCKDPVQVDWTDHSGDKDVVYEM